MAIKKKEFILLHVWGDESGISTDPTDLVPPDGKVLNVGIPNSNDTLIVVDKALLNDPGFARDWIPKHLWDELKGV